MSYSGPICVKASMWARQGLPARDCQGGSRAGCDRLKDRLTTDSEVRRVSPPNAADRPSSRRSSLIRRAALSITVAALILLLGAELAGAASVAGRYDGMLGSTNYTINVPPDWNGGLVMFAHGYEGEGSGNGTVRSSPLDAHLTERRYAWAASGYRAWGYRPDWFLLDLLTLRAHFINRFGHRAGRSFTGNRWAGTSASPRSNCIPRCIRAR